MENTRNVLVIGGGVIGVCVAYYLTEAGVPVTLVEKDDICAGSSYGNAGLIVFDRAMPVATPGVLGQAMTWLMDPESPFYIKPRPDPELVDWLRRFYAAADSGVVARNTPLLLDLNRRSAALFRAFAANREFDFGYRETGGLSVYRTRAAMAKGVRAANMLHDLGAEAAVLDNAAVRALAPVADASIVGGVYYQGEAHLQPDRFVRGLADLLRERGVNIRTHTEVIGLEAVGDRIVRVNTTRGDMQPDYVVLAAGAWTPSISRMLRLFLPVQPAKGYSITVRRPMNYPEVSLMLSERKVAVTPMGDNLRFAGTLELGGLDLSINRRRVAAIGSAVREYLHVGIEGGPVEIWRGLRAMTPDSLPIIGPSPRHANLIFATGHGMLGVSMGPVTGKLVAQQIMGDTPDFDMDAVSAARFG